MADYTNITGSLDEYDAFNTVIFLLAFFTGVFTMFTGIQQNNLVLGFFGIVFSIIPLAGWVLTNGAILSSPASFPTAAFAYWTARLLFTGPQLLGAASLSMFSLPTQSYLSLLRDLEPFMVATINGKLAPIDETVLIVGAIVVSYKAFVAEDIASKAGAALYTVGAFSVAFARLHGTVDLAFAVVAILFMGVSAGLLIAQDLGLIEIPVFPLSLGALYGAHECNNQAVMGGLFEFWDRLLSANAQFADFLVIWIIWDLVTFVAAVYAGYYFVRYREWP